MAVDPKSEIFLQRPYVEGAKVLCGGEIHPWDGPVEEVFSPILNFETKERIAIGRIAQMDDAAALRVLECSVDAWNCGNGLWPQLKLEERIRYTLKFVAKLKERRDQIIQVLQWEICKTTADATTEFDRTIQFIDATIMQLHQMKEESQQSIVSAGTRARIERSPVGLVFVIGPFNYPFNETYTAMIPALLMGNIVLMKIPTVGGLAHVLTMEAFAQSFPSGVVNFISGAGRVTIQPVMQTGMIDMFAFIGGSSAADASIQAHPHPHRLQVFLSLEGKNLGIVLPDADIPNAVEQCLLGALTFNGQRCTAIKLIFLHVSVVEAFLPLFVARVNALTCGLPWEGQVGITPIPQTTKMDFFQSLLQDATSQGAVVVNAAQGGGQIVTPGTTLLTPAVVYPVTNKMRLWKEEQFGPIVPIATYTDLDEVEDYLLHMPYGQQVALFTASADATSLARTNRLIRVAANCVGRINLNTQCARSPDVLPFSGRRSSANGTLSISESLRTFSIETVLATKATPLNDALFGKIEATNEFLAPIYDDDAKKE